MSAPQASEPGPKYFVNIEGAEHAWHMETITVGQIRELAGWDVTQQVVEVNLEDNSEKTLTDGDTVTLKPGHGFAKKIRFQRGFMDTERLEQELALLQSGYPDMESRCDDGARWVRIPRYPLGSGWAHDGAAVSCAEIVFQLPTQVGQAPYAFYVRPRIALAGGGTPSNYTATATTPWGGDFAQFSWAPLEPWVPKTDIRAGANMLNFARSFAERLKEPS